VAAVLTPLAASSSAGGLGAEGAVRTSSRWWCEGHGFSVSAGRGFSNWLERGAAWQFAAGCAACVFVAGLIAGDATQWVSNGGFDFAYLSGYWAAVAVATSTGTTFARQQRLRRRRSGKQPSSGQWWPWKP
jgi:hypothetical protein